jgi:Tfp pilus assembly protein FimV
MNANSSDRSSQDTTTPAQTEREAFTISADALHRIWNTLSYYASTTIYDGERTGGVLAGCPRTAPPTRDEITEPAKWAMHDLQKAIGVEPEQWLKDAQAARASAPVVAPDERIEEIAEAVERALIPGSKPWRIAFARALLVAQQPTPAQGGEPSGDEALMRQAEERIAELLEICRQWEPDHSSGANRRLLVLASDLGKVLRARLEGTK